MSTGALIKKARKAAGLTQKELGAKLGVSGAMIGQYETNLRNPKHDTLAKIADALHIPAYELYGEVSWLVSTKSFAIDIARAFDTLHAIRNDDNAPWVYKKLIDDDFPNLDEIIDTLPDLIATVISAALFKKFDDRTETDRAILLLFRQLNDTGRSAAIERIKELTEIPRYQQNTKADTSDNQPE